MKKIILFMFMFTFSLVTFSNHYYNYHENYRREKTDKEKKYEELYWKYDEDICSIEKEIRILDRKIKRDAENNTSNSYDLVKRKQLKTKMYNRTVDLRNDLRKNNLDEWLKWHDLKYFKS